MKLFNLLLAILLLTSCTEKVTEVTVSIVPKPVSIEQYLGEAKVKDITTGIDKGLECEEYVMTIKNGKVSIKGGSDAGVFYGRQTLAQLESQGEGIVPNLKIQDRPQFSYRGLHLDCCRHFFTVDEVKQCLDMMATHKLNMFHWHLTEDDGWRFESKKYPLLTEIGAWRDGTMIDLQWGSNDSIRYGGYYSQEEMRDVVAYAAEHFITIIPEIEMPGHSQAALASYPELGCTGGPYQVSREWGVHKDIMCVGKDNTIQFLKDILDEVCEVFPSEYIHIGGDEVPRDRWKECPSCQARMKAEGLDGEAQLQSWLNIQIENYLNAKGRKIIGWDEILEGGVSKTATVMSWRGTEGGKKAAACGNDVIMSPSTHYYFDYYQTDDYKAYGEPLCLCSCITLEQAYSFNPYEDISDDAKCYIKGIQANIWTEFMPTLDDVMFNVVPRVAALAEVAWNADGRTNYDCFVRRVRKVLVPIYKSKGWNYADYAFRDLDMK